MNQVAPAHARAPSAAPRRNRRRRRSARRADRSPRCPGRHDPRANGSPRPHPALNAPNNPASFPASSRPSVRTPLHRSMPNGSTARDRLGDVARVQSAGEVERHADGLADAPADRPVVHAAGAAELLHREQRVAGVEQQRIDERRDGHRLVDRRRAGDVDHLHEPHAGQRARAGGAARRAATRSTSWIVWCGSARAARRSHPRRRAQVSRKVSRRRRDRAAMSRDRALVDHARPARHRRDEAERRGAGRDASRASSTLAMQQILTASFDHAWMRSAARDRRCETPKRASAPRSCRPRVASRAASRSARRPGHGCRAAACRTGRHAGRSFRRAGCDRRRSRRSRARSHACPSRRSRPPLARPPGRASVHEAASRRRGAALSSARRGRPPWLRSARRRGPNRGLRAQAAGRPQASARAHPGEASRRRAPSSRRRAAARAAHR